MPDSKDVKIVRLRSLEKCSTLTELLVKSSCCENAFHLHPVVAEHVSLVDQSERVALLEAERRTCSTNTLFWGLVSRTMTGETGSVFLFL